MSRFLSKQERINVLTSEVRNFIEEQKPENMEMFMGYISSMLCVFDTDIAIAVLEQFGEEGKQEALGIKVRWGY
jgi:hypothetical protein